MLVLAVEDLAPYTEPGVAEPEDHATDTHPAGVGVVAKVTRGEGRASPKVQGGLRLRGNGESQEGKRREEDC